MTPHDAESEFDPRPLADAGGQSLPVGIPEAKVPPRQALETYWRQLELTPHAKIDLDVMALHGRLAILKDAFYRANAMISGPHSLEPLFMNWSELGVVPVGGQGLTEAERTWCKLAGRAMAAVFAEEARNGNA